MIGKHHTLWKDGVLCSGGGLAMALAFPPYDYENTVWVALLPLLSVLWCGERQSKKRCFFAGWLYGMGYYCLSFQWIRQVGFVFGISPWLFFAAAFLPLMAVYACLPGLWALVVGRWLRPLPVPEEDSTTRPHEQRAAVWASWARQDIGSTLVCSMGSAALWVCIEWLRAHGTLGFSWNSLGAALYNGLSFVQWAEFVGSTALAFIPVAMSVIIWRACRRSFLAFRAVGRARKPWDFYGAVGVLFALFTGGLFLSVHYSAGHLFAKESTVPLPVLAVQINKDQREHIDEVRAAQSSASLPSQYRRYLDATVAAMHEIADGTMRLAQQHTDLAFPLRQPAWVVWPESALPFPFLRDERSGELLSVGPLADAEALPLARQRAGEIGGPPFVLFTGVDELLLRSTPAGRSAVGMLNSIACVPGGAESVRTAAKQHLMPFGEYIPCAQDAEWIGRAYSRFTGTQAGDGIRPGKGADPLCAPLPGTDLCVGVIPAVCYEDTVGDLLRIFARPGAQVIVNSTNDAWFRDSACGVQQARTAALRCIELRRPMVRAANKGVCCAIAPNGAVIHALLKGDGTPHVPGYSYAVLPVDKQAGLTLYARWGDWAVLLCAFVAGLCLLREVRRSAAVRQQAAV